MRNMIASVLFLLLSSGIALAGNVQANQAVDLYQKYAPRAKVSAFHNPSQPRSQDNVIESNTQIRVLMKDNQRLFTLLEEQSMQAKKEKGQLKAKIGGLQEKNLYLNAQLTQLVQAKEQKVISPQNDQKGVEALKQQNKSLRDTIRAQSDALLSGDNATKTAERLLQENTFLQRKMAQMTKDKQAYAHSTKEQLARNKTLHGKIVQCDNYVKKIRAGKITESPLASAGNHSIKRLAVLEKKNRDLQESVFQAREKTLRYRTEVLDCQENALDARDKKPWTQDHEDMALEDDSTFLKLENQVLKAQVKMLSAGEG